ITKDLAAPWPVSHSSIPQFPTPQFPPCSSLQKSLIAIIFLLHRSPASANLIHEVGCRLSYCRRLRRFGNKTPASLPGRNTACLIGLSSFRNLGARSFPSRG